MLIVPSPTDLQLSSMSLDENLPSYSRVGFLSAVAGSGLKWELVNDHSGTQSADNWQFRIVGDQLLTSMPLDHEGQPTATIYVRATNQYGWYSEKAFAIRLSYRRPSA